MITGKEIRIKMAELRISQRRLAEITGLTPAYINQMCAEMEKSYLTPEKFELVEKALEKEEQLLNAPAPQMKFGKLSVVKEMRTELKHAADLLDDHLIMKLYDYSAYLTAERNAE